MTDRHTWSEIHLDQIEHNLREIRRRLPVATKFMAVVKADAYGHGCVEVANTVLKAGADALGVGLLSEAIHLRKHGIQAPILVLTPSLPADVDTAVQYDISLTVFQASWLREMHKFKLSQKPLRIHIKMDTGMGRLGIRERSELEAMLPLMPAKDVIVEGVFTHFATANQANPDYCHRQFNTFAEMRSWLSEAGYSQVAAHCSNSAAALQYPHMSLDMVRVGAALYGIDPRDDLLKRRAPIWLRTALSLHTGIVHVKHVKKGHYIGYDTSYITPRDEWIATLPIGYADGCFRGYRGFHVLVDGAEAPIAGNICMNQLMIRLPKYYPIGTKITLIGKQQEAEITMLDLANHIDSIPQQVLSMIAHRVPRVFRRPRIMIRSMYSELEESQ